MFDSMNLSPRNTNAEVAFKARAPPESLAAIHANCMVAHPYGSDNVLSYLKDVRRLHGTREIRKRISLSTVSHRRYRQIPTLLRVCALRELWKPQTSLRLHEQDSNENPIS